MESSFALLQDCCEKQRENILRSTTVDGAKAKRHPWKRLSSLLPEECTCMMHDVE
jgi:hypothetical protein